MRSLVMFFGGAISVALVVGILAVAGVIDNDPAPITQAAPPSPPASSTDRGQSRPSQATGVETISDIYKRVSRGVVFVQAGSATQGATGSGFVYDKDGHIVTNDHV